MNVGSISVCIMPMEECVINDVGRVPFVCSMLKHWGNWIWLSEFEVIPSFVYLYTIHIYAEAWKLV